MKNKFIYLLMISVFLLLSCEEDCNHLNYLGQDASIVKFTLNRETNEYPLKMYEDSVVFSVGAGFNFSNLLATVVLSEGAVITPVPSTITDWSKNMDFTVTAVDKMTTKAYKYIVHTGVSENVYHEVALLTTQAEVEAFGANEYTRVAGIVIRSVAGADEQITDLSSLNTIKVVDLGIHITSFYGKNLKGFENLRKVTSFEMVNNFVEEVTFDNLEEVTNLLLGKIYDIPTASGCDNLKNISCPKLKIVYNDLVLSGAFESYEGLSSLESVGGEMILNGENTDMKGFERLTSLTYLRIGGYYLTSLHGFQNLKSVKKSLTLSFVSNLESLDGLNLEVVGNLNINNATKLINIKALGKVKKLTSLYISGTPKLGSLEGLHNITSVNGNLTLAFVGQGRDEATSLVNLNGLRSLESIGGTLAIRQCSNLADIQALEKLTRLTNLEFEGSTKIESLMGFHNVKAIYGTLAIQDLGVKGIGTRPSTGLSNLDGFSGLEFVAGKITVMSCPNLSDFCAISDVMKTTPITPIISDNAYNPTLDDFRADRCMP